MKLQSLILPYYLSYDPTAPRAISLGHQTKKVPYDGHRRRSDRSGKTRTALLETRTVLQGARTAKSLRVQLMTEKKYLRTNFTIRANYPMQKYFSRQLTPKAQRESCLGHVGRPRSVTYSADLELGQYRRGIYSLPANVYMIYSRTS